MSSSNLKKKLSIWKKLKKHKNKIKNIKIHSFRFEREYTRTQEHEPRSQELKNTKFLGMQHLYQTLKKFTSKKPMPKIFITTLSFHPKLEIF